MAAEDLRAITRLRRTVSAYARRLIRVGVAAQTVSSAGASSLAISGLVSSAVAIAAQLQRAIVVRVVGAPLVRKRPRRRSGETLGEEYPEAAGPPSGDLAAEEEQGTDWEDVAPTSAALADLETQPFTIARMLPSMVLAQQSAFQSLALVNAAVARAVGNLGTYPASRPAASQPGFGIAARAIGETVTPGTARAMGERVIPGTGPVSQTRDQSFPDDVRELPGSTSFGADTRRESTAGGAAGTAASEVPSRSSPSKTSIAPSNRGSLVTSGPAAGASSPAKGAGQEPGTAPEDQAGSQFSPPQQRPPSGQTSFEPTPGGSPYSPQDAAPASVGGQFSAVGVAAAFRAAASSIVFDLNSSARETTTATLGSQALGTTFSPATSRPAGSGAVFQPGSSTATGGSSAGTSAAGTADATSVSTPSAQNLGLPSGTSASGGQTSSPLTSSSLGAAPASQTSSSTTPGQPSSTSAGASSLSATIGPQASTSSVSTTPATAAPAPSQAAGSAPSTSAPPSGLAAPPQSPSSGATQSLPIARAGPMSSLSAAVNAGTGAEQEAGAATPVGPSGVASSIDATGTTAAPKGLGAAFSTHAAEQAAKLSLQVSALASQATSRALPLRAGGGSASADIQQNFGVGPRSGPAAHVAGVAFSVSAIAASLGLAGAGSPPSYGFATAQPAGASSLELSPAQENRSEAVFLGKTLAGAGLGGSEAPPGLSGEREPVLESSEEGPAEARELGARLGALRSRRPRFSASKLLFGDRWLATIAAASAMGGSLFDLLGFPGYSPSRFGPMGIREGTARGLPSGLVEAAARAGSLAQLGALSGTAASPTSRDGLPAREPAIVEEVPLRAGEAGALQGRGTQPDGTPRQDYLSSGLPALGTQWSEWRAAEETAPSPTFTPQEMLAIASRSVWAKATFLPGILTASRVQTNEQTYRSPRQDLAEGVTPSPEEAADHALSVGLPLVQRSYALAAADIARRTVLAASAGPLGAGRAPHLSRSSWLARARVAALAEHAAGATETGLDGIVSTPGRDAQLSGVGAGSGAREGLPGTFPGLHVEGTRFTSILAALTSTARLRGFSVLPRAAAVFPDDGAVSSGGGPSMVREGVPGPGHGPPSLDVGTLAAERALEEPTGAAASGTAGWHAGDFFGLEAVTRALSLASRLPAASQLGGVAFIPPRHAATRARAAAQRPAAKRGQAAEVEFADDRPPEIADQWRSAPEEAISEVLSDATTRRPRGEEPDQEPDDRELRRRIEKMIDEELRRYGYQP